jgi:hypothetical protein
VRHAVLLLVHSEWKSLPQGPLVDGERHGFGKCSEVNGDVYVPRVALLSQAQSTE